MDMGEVFVEPVLHPVLLATPEDMGEPEDDPFFTSIWFDQGTHTGWSVFGVWPEAMSDPNLRIMSNIAAWSAGEFYGTEAEVTAQMMALVEAWSDGAHVGYEDFILQRFSMARDLLSPVRIAARFEERMLMAGRSEQLVPPQMASLAMRTVTDDRLKAWGFWNPLKGKDHARDAVKHNITYLRRRKEKNIKEAAAAPAAEVPAEGSDAA